MLQVYVKYITNDQLIAIEVDHLGTCADLHKAATITIGRQLLFQNKPLDNDNTPLADTGLSNEVTLQEGYIPYIEIASYDRNREELLMYTMLPKTKANVEEYEDDIIEEYDNIEESKVDMYDADKEILSEYESLYVTVCHSEDEDTIYLIGPSKGNVKHVVVGDLYFVPK